MPSFLSSFAQRNQCREEGYEFRRNPANVNREKFYADCKELGKESWQLLVQTIAGLRPDLGDEDFKKLDENTYSYTPAGMAAAAAKRRAPSTDPQ